MSPVPPALFGSCRLTLAILCFVAIFEFMLMRFNISMAIVCMTKSDGLGSNNSSYNSSGAEFQWDKDIQTSVLGAFYYGKYRLH